MYTTKYNEIDRFDWDKFFSINNNNTNEYNQISNEVFENCRENLKEDIFQFALEFNRLLNELMKGIELQKPRILELGAGTGFLTRWLIQKFNGSGVLVDKNKTVYKKYMEMNDDLKEFIDYRISDIFEFEDFEDFDITCSFGLIEHFKEKEEILKVHKKFLKKDGFIIIIVPLNTPLSRVFYEVFPELNEGYRELLSESELIQIMKKNSLEVLKVEKSLYYSYDFIGVACKVNELNK